MSLRIRGQEVTVALAVDGQIIQGSFTKVENFKITPRADLSDSPFLGESEDENDVQNHGYDFSWMVHQMDDNAFIVWDKITSALANGTVLPNVSVVVLKKYRDLGIKPVTMTLQNAVIKMDSEEYGGRKEFVKASFSGKCRTKKSRR